MTPGSTQDNKSREHLANERTFLAWIRTSIALMGFGFVIVKFALFLKEISVVMEGKINMQSKGRSAVIGVIMVALGILVAIMAYWQYRRIQRQLDAHVYVPSSILSVFVTFAILTGGILLIFYLLPNII
jgi:putative membrane protein